MMEAKKKTINDSKILICGLVKNAEKSFKDEYLKIQLAFKSFKQINWFVIESDSEDQTLSVLRHISSANSNFRFLSLGMLSSTLPIRTERLAYCRNIYLRDIRVNHIYSDIDYVVIIDLDAMNDLLNESAVMSCWDRDDWDVVTANQLGPYFDIWALRHWAWSPNDCWEQCRFLETHGVPHASAKLAAVYSKQVVISSDLEWIEVDSAFGGLAIYKRTVLEFGSYKGLSHYGNEVCEHISLNQSIKRNGGRIFINPRLVNTDFTEHTRHLQKASKLLYL